MEACPEKKAECEKSAKIETLWADFDKLSLEEQKALIEKKMALCKAKHSECDGHNHEGCTGHGQPKAEGCGGNHEGCTGHAH